MLVTIGMPVYNRPIELKRALNAALAQTYTGIEIIISNNCSPDKRVEDLIKEYLKLDSRIKYFSQVTPLPVIDNFKFVLEKASGEYFMWLADDDWIDNKYVNESVMFLSNNPDYSIACGQCKYHAVTGELIDVFKMPSIDSISAIARVIEYYKHVKLNGYFYGIRKTSLSRQIALQNKMAFDWLYLAAFIYKGKAKVFETTAMHITAGGISNDVEALNKNIGANNFMTRNFVGLTASANAATDIFKSGIYAISFFSKLKFSIKVFFTVLSKTYMWDVVHIKRMIFGRKKKLAG